jgi:hypothetical protein
MQFCAMHLGANCYLIYQDIHMLDRYLRPHYWSPFQTYATGDIVIDLLSQGWQVILARTVPDQSRARLHSVKLVRGEDRLDLLVLDGPAIQGIVFDRFQA